jgi:hypothetical protein
MSNPSDIFRSLLSRLGIAGPARSCAFQGSGAPKDVSGIGAPRIASRTVLVLATVFAATALAASPAGAAQTRRELGTFGAATSSAPDPYPLSNPQGVAVDEQTEDVYVADTGNHRIEKFGPKGEFLLAFGKEVNKTAVGLHGTPSEQDVCKALEECQPGVSGSTPGAFEHPQLVAVDNDSGSPSYHDVYVADTADNIVSKFGPEGVLEAIWGTGGQLTGFEPIKGIAVAANGTLYAATFGELGGEFGIHEFEPDSKPIHESLGYGDASLGGLGVNPAGDLFLGSGAPGESGSAQIEESLPTGELVGFVFYEPILGALSGLAVASNGDLYFATTTGAGTLDHDSFKRRR